MYLQKVAIPIDRSRRIVLGHIALLPTTFISAYRSPGSCDATQSDPPQPVDATRCIPDPIDDFGHDDIIHPSEPSDADIAHGPYPSLHSFSFIDALMRACSMLWASGVSSNGSAPHRDMMIG